VRLFTAHLRAQSAPLLVPEGFSWGALIFGPLWLAVHAAWIPAALVLAVDLGLGFVPRPLGPVLEIAAAVMTGLYGNDLRRWSLAMRGWLLSGVVAGRDEDAAFARLLTVRPDLMVTASGQV
jgi:hypothetical protein